MHPLIKSIARAGAALVGLADDSTFPHEAPSAPSKVIANGTEETNIDYYALADGGGTFITSTTRHPTEARGRGSGAIERRTQERRFTSGNEREIS